MAGIGFGTNYDVKNGNGLAGKTTIVTLVVTGGGNVAQADIDAFAQAVTISRGLAKDAFSIAAVSGVGGATVTMALQGTGTFEVGADKYVADHTTAILATFDDDAQNGGVSV